MLIASFVRPLVDYKDLASSLQLQLHLFALSGSICPCPLLIHLGQALETNMTDPIEIIQTVISVLKLICNAVQCIKGAPDEQKALGNEATRLHLVLEYLVQILGSRVRDEQSERETKALQGLCDEARKLIDLANGILGNRRTNGYNLRKVEWPVWLLKKSNREDLVKRLQKLNASMDIFFS